MNDFSDLEAELKQLRPRAASPELTTRVEAALAQEARETPTGGILDRRGKFQLNWFTLGLGTAAAAAALMLFARIAPDRAGQTNQPTLAANSATAAATQPAAVAAQTFVPDGLTRVVYQTRDEGLVFPRTADAPVRRVRSRARETLQWREPGTGASLRVSYPTEEVELIPVSGQ